jgi:hypothetical protein
VIEFLITVGKTFNRRPRMNLEELYCLVDDFCQLFMPEWESYLLTHGQRKRKREGYLTTSEIMTIFLLFQSSGYRDFKHYYLGSVLHGNLGQAFPKAISYTRFVALIPSILIPLSAFLPTLYANLEGLGFIDSTPIAVCHPKRISSHRVFHGFAKLGKTTKGWFFGFKLHLICNAKGELCACYFTPGNVNDCQPVEKMTVGMVGKLFGDKGYINQLLGEKLFDGGLQLITGIRKNMKNKLLTLMDKILLRKRSLIESTNNQLKNVFHLEHSRHRSPFNGFASFIAAVIAYALHPNKPSLHLDNSEMKRLIEA